MSRVAEKDSASEGREEDRSATNGRPPSEAFGRGTPTPKRPAAEKDGERKKPADEDETDEKEDKQAGQDKKEKEQSEKKPTGPPLYRRPAFWIVAVIVVIVGGTIGLSWWLHARHRISTDDAFITAHYTTVSPRVSGHVVNVRVDDNQDVKKGDILLVLDDKDFVQAVKSAAASHETAQAQLVQANANLAATRAAVAQAQADVSAADASAREADADLKRYRSVQEADPRAVSKQQVDQAEAKARTNTAQLEAARQKQGAAEAQVAVAQAQTTAAQASIDKARSDLDNANLQLSYTKIYAAEDGQVTNRSVEIGNYVTPGQALMALVPREVWVTANYKETQLKKMQVGQAVKIHVDAYDIDLPGHVQSIQAGSGAAFSLLPPENATGNYVKVVQRLPVKITFDKLPDRRLAPGMSVEATVDTQTR